ncbi:hypothetical protein [Geosporobacter ferrireducens]|uniref:Uncharacterized protein n=1 Tax=Geosporobacter ferrireducens TaxID=1424294 RepID=A0A1D8GLP0_9FIRM|nr:hypothetical protein [Geosporobacter ferrireducens]AOT71835.1 hypothetical protein Gferi_21240 [Geosporobacter ferrireducens]MTI55622.1 hypothetical protein [Geosporobacter ferrireducens]
MNENSITSLLEEWEQTEKKRIMEQAVKVSKRFYHVYLPIMFVVIVGMLVGIGIMVEAPVKQILTMHVGIGVGLFAFNALILMFVFSKSRLVKKLMKELRKEIDETLETEEDRLAFARDMLENGNHNMYTYRFYNNMLRVLFGKRFILQKDVTYYILIDTQKVEGISVDRHSLGHGAGRTENNYVVFHYPPSGKKSLIFDVDKKKMRFDGKGNRDDVFQKAQSTYNIPVIQK